MCVSVCVIIYINTKLEQYKNYKKKRALASLLQRYFKIQNSKNTKKKQKIKEKSCKIVK